MEKEMITQFLKRKVSAYTEPVKLGLEKGLAVGPMRPKYLAAVLSLTDAKPKVIAEDVGTTSGTVRVWKTEHAFKKLVGELAEEFAGEFWAAFGRYWEDANKAYSAGESRPNHADYIGNTELWGDAVVLAIFGHKPEWVTKVQAHAAVTMIVRQKDKMSETINAVNVKMKREYHADCIRIMQNLTISDDDRLYVLHYLRMTADDK